MILVFGWWLVLMVLVQSVTFLSDYILEGKKDIPGTLHTSFFSFS